MFLSVNPLFILTEKDNDSLVTILILFKREESF